MSMARDAIYKSEKRLDRSIWIWVAVIGFVFALINVTSLQMEAARNGEPALGIWPLITEGSSLLSTLIIFPLLAYLVRIIPFSAESWRRASLLHLVGSIGFSALHVSIMVGLRKLAYPVFLNQNYNFFGDVVREILYEYRKDFASYFLLVSGLYVVRALAQQSRELEAARLEAKKTGRLSLKCGARTLHIPAEDFVYAQAAGNYVDVFIPTGQHLVRTSLTALQKQLEAAGIQALRIHRTRLVNAKAIGETRPAGSSDLNVI
ncbi:MAG: hypothetical protein COA84_02385 [Robiginitomaculum sp.]|nr:MAG: hypothetical protein COA84_02385 [Robiginitomaculum sp.]